MSSGPREDVLAEGILGILGPAVEHVDQKIAEVRCAAVRSQHLCSHNHSLFLSHPQEEPGGP